MRMPLVSVIMPSYNHGKFVSEAIESICNQSISDWELIIVDDASEDNSRKIIQDYMKKDHRIVATFHDENMGIARSLNDGLERASGKFISFFASDDIWVRDKLEKQLKVLEKDENLIVWSEGEIIDAHGIPTGKLFTQRARASCRKKNGDLFEELLRGTSLFGTGRIVKRENVEGIRFNEDYKYINDYQYELDIARRCKYYFIETPLTKYRLHGRNTVTLSKRNGGLFRENIILRWRYFKQYRNEISNKTKLYLLCRIGTACLGLCFVRNQTLYNLFIKR